MKCVNIYIGCRWSGRFSMYITWFFIYHVYIAGSACCDIQGHNNLNEPNSSIILYPPLLNDILMFPFRGYCIWMLFVMEEKEDILALYNTKFLLSCKAAKCCWQISHHNLLWIPVPFLWLCAKRSAIFHHKALHFLFFWWWQTDNPFQVSFHVEVKL